MSVLADQETEQTTGGLVGKLTGQAKELTGSLVGDNDLAREGRLQQSQVAALEQETKKRHAAKAEERLKAVDAKADAPREKEKELAARDEARRLRDAAGRAKTQRKAD